MLEFFTILTAIYIASEEPRFSFVLLPSEMSCGKAIVTTRDMLSPHYEIDSITCTRTEIISASPAPRYRPEGEPNE